MAKRLPKFNGRIRECFEPGCTLKESEHWFEHGAWHPHEFDPGGHGYLVK